MGRAAYIAGCHGHRFVREIASNLQRYYACYTLKNYLIEDMLTTDAQTVLLYGSHRGSLLPSIVHHIFFPHTCLLLTQVVSCENGEKIESMQILVGNESLEIYECICLIKYFVRASCFHVDIL